LWPSKGQICFIKWCLHVESSIIIPDKFLSRKNQSWMRKPAGFLTSIDLFFCFQMVCVYIYRLSATQSRYDSFLLIV
jgi:hypothetical protein